MPMVIKYKISVRLAGNLRINVEPFLKMAVDGMFLSGVSILKPLKIGGARFNSKVHLFTTRQILVDYYVKCIT